MSSDSLTLVLMLWVVCGVAAGLIASHKGLSFGSFFFLGLITGFIGLIIALVVKPAARVPVSAPGWYADPWQPGNVRYHDGAQWTAHTNQPVS